jgi:hypothetical protein
VVLQVEENLISALHQLAHKSRPFSGEQLFADFKEIRNGGNCFRRLPRSGGAGKVERHN